MECLNFLGRCTRVFRGVGGGSGGAHWVIYLIPRRYFTAFFHITTNSLKTRERLNGDLRPIKFSVLSATKLTHLFGFIRFRHTKQLRQKNYIFAFEIYSEFYSIFEIFSKN